MLTLRRISIPAVTALVFGHWALPQWSYHSTKCGFSNQSTPNLDSRIERCRRAVAYPDAHAEWDASFSAPARGNSAPSHSADRGKTERRPVWDGAHADD
jgi:hypothetical protein